MRMLIYLFASFVFFAFQILQSIDFYTVADKYGVPVAFSLLIFGLLVWFMRKGERERSQYLSDIRESNDKQVTFLQSLLAESRKQSAFCKFQQDSVTSLSDEKRHD